MSETEEDIEPVVSDHTTCHITVNYRVSEPVWCASISVIFFSLIPLRAAMSFVCCVADVPGSVDLPYHYA